MKNKSFLVVGGSVLASVLLMGSTVFAQTNGSTSSPSPTSSWRGHMGQMPGVFGTVSAINGTTLTVTSKAFGSNTTQTTYTVNAASATVTKNGSSSSVSNIAVGDTVMVQGTVSGTSVTATAIRDGMMGRMGMNPGVFGTVASVSGNTLTVTSKMGPSGSTTSTTYTVNATSATVTKNGSSSSVSNIAVGDNVVVQGTVSGTSVTATTIRDGVPQMKPATPVIQGNGQPVVGGTVTAVNGSTLTITTAKGNVSYAIDATNATVEKGGITSSISNIAVGDNVVVQGTVSGTSVTASSIIDQGAAKTSLNSNSTSGAKGLGGFVGAIGGFFQHLFGFF